MKKRLLAGIASFAMAVGLMPFAALANTTEAAATTQTATNLDQDYISEVTLSFPSDGYRRPLDVVFVLDGSTSTDQEDLAAAAASMLDDLAGTEKLDVKAGLVVFGGSTPILESTELLDLSDEGNLEEISKRITDKNYKQEDGRSGSNLQAGIEVARDLLKTDTDANTSKYIVLLTDGAARMWYNKEEGASVAKCFGGTDAGHFNTNSDFEARYLNTNRDIRQFDSVFTADAEVVGQYSVTFGNWTEATEITPYLQEEDFYTNMEAATYFAAKSLQEIKDSDEASVLWVDYPYDAGGKYDEYTESFKSWLAAQGYISRYDSSEASDPSEMFEKIKNNWIYYVDAGSELNNVVGNGTDNDNNAYDFQMVNLDQMKLTFGGEELETVEMGDNHYGFRKYGETANLFELTYYPNGENSDGQESFELAINTAVKLDQKVTLSYQVQLTNPQTAAGTYGTYDEDGSENYTALKVSNSTALYPVDSDGNPGTSLGFPLPTVSYTVQEIKVTPASLTIYMGGSSGYTNIVGEDGQTLQDTVSLPEPGFYLELPDSVNTELRQILGKDENDVIDLSPYVTLTADTGNGTSLSWKLERYGAGDEETTSAGFIDNANRFIYKIVPVNGGAQVRVKVNSRTAGSDEFDATNALFATYDMEIYGEGIEEGALTAKIQVQGASGEPDKYNKTFSLKGGDPATLTVRYVAGQQEDVVTPALDSITEAHDAGKAYVVLQDLNGNAAEDFIINRAVQGSDGTTLTVQADAHSVALLFDDIVSASDTGDQGTHFEKTLVDKAVSATGQNFQNLQYQAKYLDLVEADNGNTWLTTNDKVTVYWPYPEGTNADTTFYLEHFDGIDRDGTLDAITAEVEGNTPVAMEVHTDANGIYFETDSFSPYVLMWDEPTVTAAEEDNNEEQPAATAQPTPAPTAAPEAEPTAASVTAAIPQTGDAAQPLLWAALACLSGAALAALTLYRRKRSDR